MYGHSYALGFAYGEEEIIWQIKECKERIVKENLDIEEAQNSRRYPKELEEYVSYRERDIKRYEEAITKLENQLAELYFENTVGVF